MSAKDVCNAAKNGNLDDLVTALTLHPNLIDTPKPRDFEHRTPLHRAALHGHVAVVERLIELGSQAIDTPDKFKRTPLYAAAEKGHVSVIETLVRSGSNAIDSLDHNGSTPLYAAAISGHVSVIEALVRLGSNAIDTPNNNGCTPMYAATIKGHDSVIRALVQLGSHARAIRNNAGLTPLDLASSSPTPKPKVIAALKHNWLDASHHNAILTRRHRVHFSFSLVDRLLLQLARSEGAPIQEQERKCVVS